MKAIKPIKSDVLVWADNIRGPSSKMIRAVGGIPIPEGNQKAAIKYMSDVNKYIRCGGWLHIYAEGSMWEYYKPIRPFKVGAAHLAIKNHVPVIPVAFTYRNPSWVRRKFFHQIALLTLHIGEAIFPDEAMSESEAKEDLTIKLHDSVCSLAGINPSENIYPEIYHKNKRIDY